MKFEIVTIFPDFFRGPLDYGIVRRAREAAFIEILVHDLRAFTTDRHKTVDDRPFGGGEGMVLKPEPLFECVESLQLSPREQRLAGEAKETVVLLSPQGRMFTQAVAEEMAALQRIVLICGRYEGVDERVAESLADQEISIGDYVLSGGGLLDYPHYTRPAEFRGMAVPEVLIGGNHEQIRKWRRGKALEKTLRNRPELLERQPLSEEDRKFLADIDKANSK